MFKHKVIYFLLFLATAFFILYSCDQNKNIKDKPTNQLNFSSEISELILDTTSVNPLIDSLKNQIQLCEGPQQIVILGELAENWRPFTFYLANEELNQSKQIKNIYGEGDALCKFGIYYCRKFNFDSANYYLDQASSIALKNNLKVIMAQAKSWKAEVLRQSGEINEAISLQNNAIYIAAKVNDKKRLAFCNISKGEAYRIQGEFNKAIECYNKSIEYATEINDLNKITVCYNSLGDVYRIQNNYPKALEYFNKGLAIARKNKNKNQIAFCLNCMGDIYSTQQEFSKSLTFYEQAYTIAQEQGLKLQECQSLSSIGMTYYLLNKKEEALTYFEKTIKIAEEIGNKDKMSFAYSIMGDLYSKKGNPEKALECYNKSIDVAQETGNKSQLGNTYNQLSEHYLSIKKINEAKLSAEKALSITKETQTPQGIKTSAALLTNIFEAQDNYKEAFKMLRLFILMRDSTRNEENIKQFAAVEYKAKEQSLKVEQIARDEAYKAQQAQKEEELKRQKTIRYAFTIGFVLVLLLVVVVFRSLQQNKKKNKIITTQKKEVEHQKELVEEKNKEITDSITYAKRLQDAILPPLKLVQQYFPESFILYKPKDIIAGDFYWMENAGDVIFFAAADSTGHGVPGAMVSVVCSNALNRAIKEFKLIEPGKILDKTRELVLETFEKSEGDVKDGMDISLVCVNRKSKTILWSGANNPLWFINETGFNEIKAHKQSIGNTENPTPFPTHELEYKTGTLLYLITDGFADQFGGPKGKKFKYKQLQEQLVLHKNKPLEEQYKILAVAFEDWRGPLDQIDDVTILGFKI